MMLLTQILILMVEISMIKNSLKTKSFAYSVLVTSLKTEKGRELVKEFEGDARTIVLKLHHDHTQSNVAQHEVVTLTTYITNLNLTDSWKGTTDSFSVTSRRNSGCLIIQTKMIHLHIQFLNLLSTLLNLRNPPKFLFLTNFGEIF